MTRPNCHRCDTPAMLRRQAMTSGAEHIGWYCPACQRWALKGQPFVSRHDAEIIAKRYGKGLADIPAIDAPTGEPCLICAHTESELHHFAPQEYADLFDEWARWPTAWLCRKHHSQWHELVQGRKIR